MTPKVLSRDNIIETILNSIDKYILDSAEVSEKISSAGKMATPEREPDISVPKKYQYILENERKLAAETAATSTPFSASHTEAAISTMQSPNKNDAYLLLGRDYIKAIYLLKPKAVIDAVTEKSICPVHKYFENYLKTLQAKNAELTIAKKIQVEYTSVLAEINVITEEGKKRVECKYKNLVKGGKSYIAFMNSTAEEEINAVEANHKIELDAYNMSFDEMKAAFKRMLTDALSVLSSEDLIILATKLNEYIFPFIFFINPAENKMKIEFTRILTDALSKLSSEDLAIFTKELNNTAFPHISYTDTKKTSLISILTSTLSKLSSTDQSTLVEKLNKDIFPFLSSIIPTTDALTIILTSFLPRVSSTELPAFITKLNESGLSPKTSAGAGSLASTRTSDITESPAP